MGKLELSTNLVRTLSSIFLKIVAAPPLDDRQSDGPHRHRDRGGSGQRTRAGACPAISAPLSLSPCGMPSKRALALAGGPSDTPFRGDVASRKTHSEAALITINFEHIKNRAVT